MSLPIGTFVTEDYCRCGAPVDRYEAYDGRQIEYADPDTGEKVTTCPNCGRGLSLLGQDGRPSLEGETARPDPA